MTKELLEQYPDICAEIEEIKADNTTDTVSASSEEYPFGLHTVTIRGTEEAKAKRLGELYRQKTEIESFIESLSTSKERRVVHFRVKKKMSWDQVEAKTGYTIDACKKTYKKIFENGTNSTKGTNSTL